MVEANGLVNCPIAAETTADTRTWKTNTTSFKKAAREKWKRQPRKQVKETDFVVQNTGDVVDRDAVAGELRDTTEWRRGGGDGSSSGGRGIFGIPEFEKFEAAAEIEKVKYHNWMNKFGWSSLHIQRGSEWALVVGTCNL